MSALLPSDPPPQLPPPPPPPPPPLPLPPSTTALPHPTDEEDTTYIDYDTFLSPTFSPHTFTNSLILHTNHPTPSDPTLDLTTPLSRVLFDLQEIDSHIHTLTTSNAHKLLAYSRDSYLEKKRWVEQIESVLGGVRKAYERLEKEVEGRRGGAEEVVKVVDRMSGVVGALRVVSRAVVLGRQLEVQVGEFLAAGGAAGGEGGGGGGGGDWKALLRAGYTLAELRRMFTSPTMAEVEKLQCLQTLLTGLVNPVEAYIKATAIAQVMAFAVPPAFSGAGEGGTPTTPTTATTITSSSSSSFVQQKSLEAMLSRTSIALQILYLISPTPTTTTSSTTITNLLTSTLQTHLTSLTTTSLSALSRCFSSLTPTQPAPPALERSLAEIETKIRGIVVFEEVLRGVPLHSVTLPDAPVEVGERSGRKKGRRKDERKPDDKDNDNFHNDNKLLHPDLEGQVDEDSDLDSSSEEDEPTLLTYVLTDLDTSTLPTYFFRSLGSGLETLVRNVLARGGVAARGLRAGKDKVRDGLKGVVERGLVPGGGVVVGFGVVSGAGGAGGVGKVGGEGGKGRWMERERAERAVGMEVIGGAVERGFSGR